MPPEETLIALAAEELDGAHRAVARTIPAHLAEGERRALVPERRKPDGAAADERPRTLARRVVPDLPSRAPCAVSGVGPEEDQAACVIAHRARVACSFVPDV
jgi:hypothetical protein